MAHAQARHMLDVGDVFPPLRLKTIDGKVLDVPPSGAMVYVIYRGRW